MNLSNDWFTKTCLLIFSCGIFWCIVAVFIKFWIAFKMMRKFDGPECSSLILGHFDFFLQGTDKMLRTIEEEYAKKYYPHFSLRLLHQYSVNIVSPEDVEIIIGSKKHSSKSAVYLLLKFWLRQGLLVSRGAKWAQRRKILTPSFHFSILKDFVTVFNEQTEKLLDSISQQCEKPINISPIAAEFALCTISETAMGHQLREEDEDQKEYRDSIYDTEKILEHKLGRPWYHIPLIYPIFPICWRELGLLKILHNFTRKIIDERMKNFKGISGLESLQTKEEDDADEVYMKGRKQRLAMLDVLLQANRDGEQIDYEGIREEVDTFMFEGHDTTGTAISFCLMLIANHPLIQEKVYEEVKAVLGGKNRPDYNDMKKMDLLERCIKESLRIYPSVFFISRVLDEDTTLNSGLVVPKNTMVNIYIRAIHTNPEIFPEPFKFDPDRFLPDNCQNRHPFAYIPFSAGPRNCIGQRFAMLELKTLIARIILNFKLTAVDTPETIKLHPVLVLRTFDGIKVKFDPRN